MSKQEKPATPEKTIRCAIYTRKSVTEGLEQEFNTLHAQREAAEAFIRSQTGEGWTCLPQEYSDGGFSGGDIDRPGVKQLLQDVEDGKIDCIVVYKVDRLSRSLLDFARMMEILERNNCAFVSVTQQFNTSHSMGRLTLNILLSFAQFEREIISERTRDKVAAARRKGKWTGGCPVLGYDITEDKRLAVNPDEARRVRAIFELYLQHQAMLSVVKACAERGWTTKAWTSAKGRRMGGRPLNKPNIYQLLTNPLYLGKLRVGDELVEGEHEAVIDDETFSRVRSLMKRNRTNGGATVRNKHDALLRGLLFCAKSGYALGHTFTRKGGKLYRYYVNTQAGKLGWDACATTSIPAAEIEAFVIGHIRAVGKDRELQKQVFAEITEGGDKISRSDIRHVMEQFDPLWDQMTTPEKTRLLELLIEKIMVDSEDGTVAITFRPSGIRSLIREDAA